MSHVRGKKLKKHIHDDNRIQVIRSIYEVLQSAYDNRSEYEKDIWDMRKLGASLIESSSDRYLNFTRISQPWLRQAVKAYIKYCLATQAGSTCRAKVTRLTRFSNFLTKYASETHPEDINRSLIIEYLGHLASLDKFGLNSRINVIGTLKDFLEVSAREGWTNVPNKHLIFDGDYPKGYDCVPRYIPQQVINQLNQHLDALPFYMMRMVLVIQETGRRISEICCLRFNCLRQDSSRGYFLIHTQFKMKQEDSIPISREIVAVIQEQQEFVSGEWGKSFPYLFPTPKPYGKGKPVQANHFNKTLQDLAFKKNICDSSGEIYQFQSHQFRHTVGTTMINNGVPQHIVQRYLGHKSPTMTSVYAHIFDQTLKEEFTKFKDKMVDATGKVVSYESVVAEIAYGVDPNSIDAQWLKKNIRAQALPNGLCGLPVNQPVCPYGANKCLTGSDGKGCSHFKTDIRYYDKHKEHLARTNEIVEWAQENPDSRRSQEVLKLNLPVKQNLEYIITTLSSQQNEE